jgi:hypothetical protein
MPVQKKSKILHARQYLPTISAIYGTKIESQSEKHVATHE